MSHNTNQRSDEDQKPKVDKPVVNNFAAENAKLKKEIEALKKDSKQGLDLLKELLGGAHLESSKPAGNVTDIAEIIKMNELTLSPEQKASKRSYKSNAFINKRKDANKKFDDDRNVIIKMQNDGAEKDVIKRKMIDLNLEEILFDDVYKNKYGIAGRVIKTSEGTVTLLPMSKKQLIRPSHIAVLSRESQPLSKRAAMSVSGRGAASLNRAVNDYGKLSDLK